MLRKYILIIAVVFAITSAASAQIVFSVGIGGGNRDYRNDDYYYNNQPYQQQGGYVYTQNQCPPGHYYCNTHQSYCNHGQQGYQNDDRRYRQQRKQAKRWGRQQNRGNRGNNGNQGCPPGHYYCSTHRSYCSH